MASFSLVLSGNPGMSSEELFDYSMSRCSPAFQLFMASPLEGHTLGDQLCIDRFLVTKT